MSWNPLSNGRLASGMADIPACLKAGIRVGMGVDGEASADVADPFENMRTGLYAIRDKYEDATIMSPYDVLRMHTMGSADVLGVADRLGSLEPGKFADFLMVDPTRFRTVFDPYASLVFVAGERDLERVYVSGDLLVQNGALLKQDMAKVRTEVNRRVECSALKKKDRQMSKWRRSHVVVVADDNARLKSTTEVFYAISIDGVCRRGRLAQVVEERAGTRHCSLCRLR